MPTQKRVIIYCRVSTDDQIDNTSLEQQEIDGREYCDELDFIVIDVIKEVYTGSVWRERKLFMKMRERYLAGEVQGVVVRTYSRFTRMIADYFVLTQEMREHNVKLYCVKEQYDDSPLGRCLQVMQMGFNENERETTRQRTIDGKRARVLNKQLYLAGKKPPYGLQFDDAKVKGKLIVNETEAAVVRDILHMRAAKNTIYSITKYLNDQHIPAPNGKLWNERSVRMIIERANDMYRGIAYAYKYEFTKEYRNGKLTTVKRVRPEEERLLLPEGTIPRIIDDETARLALGTAAINAQEASRNNHNPKGSLLRSGFIKCGVCGRAMSIHTKKKTEHAIYPYYRCTKISLANRGDHEHIEISVPKIDAIVWSYLCKVIKGAENAIAECQALIAQYREDLKTTGLSKSARAVLLEDLGIQTELSEALEAELAAIRAGRLSYERVMQEYRTFIDWCLDFKKNGREQATYREKRDALRFLGVAVYIYTEESPEGRYKIRLSPPDLMRSLKVVPKNIAGASSG